MGHNINFNEKTQKYSLFAVKDPAWGGLGQVIADYPTSAEAISHAQLDFTVEKRPLFTFDTENNRGNLEKDTLIPEIEVPDYFATVRTDTDQVLGVVGSKYKVFQNIEAFNFMDTLAGEGVRYETAGALGNGEQIFITAVLPDHITIGRNDDILNYLFLKASHDGNGLVLGITPIRITCSNTLNAAIKNCSNLISIRHTENMETRLEDARRVLTKSAEVSAAYKEIFSRWAKIRISDKQLKKLIKMAMAPNPETLESVKQDEENFSSQFINVCDQVLNYHFEDHAQQMETTKGTLFGAFNAVTGYFQNVKTFKSSEEKLKSILYGGAAQVKAQRAFDLCKDFEKWNDF
ncbi:DUF932 domain-containing protein [Chitinophaga niabensis]|uniref:Phage/plasmid-like protein TIGR03299 n=1 Tax=Chitinophaga niabensis TaxID=536979 RepID=A0A1N6E2N4_9BACT|nr:DUF932 domain-containing protein [Chitinophaga niabensis]SIN77279.1 phage/plasmid-like protein TIGR03299 [Chitinophaga niabensis]